MTKLNALMHPVKKEFQRERCGFDHTAPDDFVKSQWQSRSKSIAYLIYRWFIALFFIAVVIDSMWPVADDESSYWLYFIYMTNWGIWMCMLTNVLGAVLVTIWHYHPEYADKLLNLGALTSPFRVYWSMHIISLELSILITITYWTLLYDANETVLDALNILTHAFNSICMFIDLWIVAHPMRLLHIFLPVVFIIVYIVFSVVYHLFGGVNNKGQPYIYYVLDWNKPESTTLTVFGVLLLACCVYILLFGLYKLRIFLYRRLNNDAYFLPTTISNNEKSCNTLPNNGKVCKNGIQHSPSGISMVLGNIGYENQGFTASSENVQKI